MSDEQGAVEQCRPPWHSVECYTGQLPGFCGEPSDPPWQPTLEEAKSFATAHVRGDMGAADAAWTALNRTLAAHDAADRRLAEEATRREELLAKLTDGTTVLMDKLARREALLRQSVGLLGRVLAYDDGTNPNDLSAYADARSFIAWLAEHPERRCDETGHYYAPDATHCYCGNTGIAAQPESEEVGE